MHCVFPKQGELVLILISEYVNLRRIGHRGR
jgi:hypothetical protein